MPAPIIFRNDALSNALAQAGAAIGKGLMKRGEYARKQMEQDELMSLINGYPMQGQQPPGQMGVSANGQQGMAPSNQDNALQTVLSGGQPEDTSLPEFLQGIQNYENQTGEFLTPEQIDERYVDYMMSQEAPKDVPESDLKIAKNDANILNELNSREQTPDTPIMPDNIKKALELKKPGYGRFVSGEEARKQQAQMQEKQMRQKFAGDMTKQYREYLSNAMTSLPTQERVVQELANSLENGDQGFQLRNVGADWAKNAGYESVAAKLISKDRQVYDSGKKELILAMMRSLKGQGRITDQMFSVISDSATRYGADPKANAIVLEGLSAGLKTQRAETDFANRIIEAYAKKGEYPPADLQAIVEKSMKPKREKINKDFFKARKQIDQGKVNLETEYGKRLLKQRIEGKPIAPGLYPMADKDGNIYKVPKKDVLKRQRDGWGLIR